MAWTESTALGQATAYGRTYDPGLLCPLDRREGRRQIGLGDALPFHGVDIWRNYEVSWLDALGKPVVAIANLEVPAASPFLIESKSLKLYFNGLNFTRFSGPDDVITVVSRDLSAAAGVPVRVTLFQSTVSPGPSEMPGVCLDMLTPDIRHYHPEPGLLKTTGGPSVREVLHSHLLRSNCPVTGQPDWGSVAIRYEGAPIDHAGLLAYVVSFREHNDFHEQCVERMFHDLMARCRPEKLTVFACYTRRGGLDINPFRSNWEPSPATVPRLARQ